MVDVAVVAVAGIQQSAEIIVNDKITGRCEMSSGGDCYEAAGKFMMDECMFGGVDDCQYILVHGEVMGQGPIAGIPFGHAWVLDGSTVIDKSNGRNITIPMEIYYAIGQIDRINNIIEYSWEEARTKILDYGHWGPWDLETESGL